jgi:hypothetical protein
MPAIVEADDDGTYVLKFRGAGQGPKALIAELVAGEIGRALGLPIPEIVFVELDASFGQSEPDPEIQQLIQASAGLNLALDFLPGSFSYDPVAAPHVEPGLASAIVWFDAYVTNVDRTPRNPNILLWHQRLWLVDHGAALYFHHRWDDYLSRSRDPFVLIKNHVLLRYASKVDQVDAGLRDSLTLATLEAIVAALPDEWLEAGGEATEPAEIRSAYLTYLVSRLQAAPIFVEEAQNARAALV